MSSLSLVLLPLLYAATLADARSPYHVEKTKEMSDWNKRHFHAKEDHYGFLTDEHKRPGFHPDQDYMEFLVGDKRASQKDDEAYWDFIGANFKRTNTRKKRSSDGVRQKTNPAVTGSGDPQHQAAAAAGSQRRLDPRSAAHDGAESWDDFVLGKRQMNFDDFLVGDKRAMSDYDYAEFVLGKRP